MSARLDAIPVASTHLSADELSRLHGLLLEERAAQMARAVELQDPLDLEPDLAGVLLARCREALDEIETALRLIDQGTYGLCAGCGAAIRYERLEVVPSARHCVGCQAGHRRGLP